MSAGMICLQMDDGLYMMEAKSLLTWNTPGKPQTLCMWWIDIQFCLKDALFFFSWFFFVPMIYGHFPLIYILMDPFHHSDRAFIVTSL